MPTTVTPTSDPADDTTPDVSHLDAAKAHSWGNDSPADDKSADPKPNPSDKPADTSFKSGLLKSKAPATDASDSDTQDADLSDIDSLTGPDEKSKSFSGWSELKEKAKEARIEAHATKQELESLRAQLAEKEKTGAVDKVSTERIRELEDQNKQMSERLKTVDLKSHPEFEAQYTIPEKQAIEKAKAVLTNDEIDDVDLDELLSLKGREFNKGLSELTDRMTKLAANRFVAQIDKIVDIRSAAEEATKGASEFLATADKRTAAAQRAAFDKVSAKYDSGLGVLEIPEGASDEDRSSIESYNADLASLTEKAAQSVFSAGSNEAISEMAIKAELGTFLVSHTIPRLEAMAGKTIADRDAKISTLESELKRLTDASPSIDS